MIIRELMTKLGFEVDEKPLARIEQHIESLHRKLEFLAGAAIAKKLYDISERFANWGDNIGDMAEVLGISTDELQKLQFVAEKAGTSAEDMGHSLAHLSRHLYEAQQGSTEAVQSFLKVGFTPEQIQSFKSADEVMYALSDQMAGMPNQMAKMAVAQEFMGRGGFKMVQMLGSGSAALHSQASELQKLGLVLSVGQVNALGQADDAFKRFGALLNAIGGQIAAFIGPAFGALIDDLIKFYGANKDIIGQNIQEWLLKFAYGLGFVVGLTERLVMEILGLAKRFDHSKDIVSGFFKVIGAATGLWLFVKAMNVVNSVFGAFSILLTPVKLAISGIMGAVGLLGDAFLAAAAGVGALMGLEGLGALLAGGGLIAAAITAIVVAVHDLNAQSEGKIGWISQFVDWLANIREIKIEIETLKRLFAGIEIAGLKDLKDFFVWSKNLGENVFPWIVPLEKVLNGEAIKAATAALEKLKALGGTGWDWVKFVGENLFMWLGPLELIGKALNKIFGIGDFITQAKEKYKAAKESATNQVDYERAMKGEGLSLMEKTSRALDKGTALEDLGNAAKQQIIQSAQSVFSYVVNINVGDAAIAARDGARVLGETIGDRLQEMHRQTMRDAPQAGH